MYMKNSLSLFLSLFFSAASWAQPGNTKPAPKPAPKQPAAKPVAKPVTPVLKNLDDSVGYCVGISVANFYRQMEAKKLNTGLLSRGLNDRLGRRLDTTDRPLRPASCLAIHAANQIPSVSFGDSALHAAER